MPSTIMKKFEVWIRKRLVLPFVYFIFSLFFFVSCNKNLVMENHQNIEGDKWDYTDVKTFTAEITDTIQHYNIYVSLRHGFNFEWRNMRVKIETTFPNGEKYERRINLILSEADGVWQGDILGDNCDIVIPIQDNALFPEIGKYSFKISQDMRVNPLIYVKSVGMRIEKYSSPK